MLNGRHSSFSIQHLSFNGPILSAAVSTNARRSLGEIHLKRQSFARHWVKSIAGNSAACKARRGALHTIDRRSLEGRLMIDLVAADGMAQLGQVDADLMRAAGLQAALDKRVVA